MFGSYLGIGSGSQYIESVDARWEQGVKSESRGHVLEVLPATQALYISWNSYSHWGEAVDFNNFPTDINPALVNGRSLGAHGKSTAKEYFQSWHKSNYVNITRTTGDITVDGPLEATTSFYVKYADNKIGMEPADGVMTSEQANVAVDVLVLQGDVLVHRLEELGIISDYCSNSQCHKTLDE